MVSYRLTLVFYITLLTLLFSLTDASPLHNHARMIKKRQNTSSPAANNPLQVVNIGDDPTDPTAPGAAAATQRPPRPGVANGGNNNAQQTGVPVTPGNAGNSNGNNNNNLPSNVNGAQNPKNTGTPAEQTNANDDGGLFGLPSVTGILGGGDDDDNNVLPIPSSSQSISQSSLSFTASVSSSTPIITSTPPAVAPTQPQPNNLITVTSTDSSGAQQTSAADVNNNSANASAPPSSSPHVARNTIIAIVAVVASVGVAVLIWTIIRKWKLGPSDQFEDRLNPIDWNPSSENINGSQDMSQRRRVSIGSNRSFVSADALSNNHSYNGGGGGMISDLPNHDFTAGPQSRSLAPMGTYADLRRGPSPAPLTAMDHSSLMRGNSYNRGGPYGAAGVGYNGQYGGGY